MDKLIYHHFEIDNPLGNMAVDKCFPLYVFAYLFWRGGGDSRPRLGRQKGTCTIYRGQLIGFDAKLCSCACVLEEKLLRAEGLLLVYVVGRGRLFTRDQRDESREEPKLYLCFLLRLIQNGDELL